MKTSGFPQHHPGSGGEPSARGESCLRHCEAEGGATKRRNQRNWIILNGVIFCTLVIPNGRPFLELAAFLEWIGHNFSYIKVKRLFWCANWDIIQRCCFYSSEILDEHHFRESIIYHIFTTPPRKKQLNCILKTLFRGDEILIYIGVFLSSWNFGIPFLTNQYFVVHVSQGGFVSLLKWKH